MDDISSLVNGWQRCGDGVWIERLWSRLSHIDSGEAKTETSLFSDRKYPLSSWSCAAVTMVDKGKSRKDEVVTREYTIHLHKRLHSWYVFFSFTFWHSVLLVFHRLLANPNSFHALGHCLLLGFSSSGLMFSGVFLSFFTCVFCDVLLLQPHRSAVVDCFLDFCTFLWTTSVPELGCLVRMPLLLCLVRKSGIVCVCVCVNCGRLICNDVEYAMLGTVLLHIWLRYGHFC